MTALGNQRWRGGRDSYRLPDETIPTREYDVERIPDDRSAKVFVTTHHYSATYPAARVRFGLFHHGELAGVAVFSHPCSDRVLTSVFPVPATAALELGRFVLLDRVPGNGETWFLARCFASLRRDGFAGVVSFSDPVPRLSTAGATVFPGHVGTIYQAANGRYLGRGTPRTLRLLPDGTVFSARAVSKIRALDRGWEYAAAQLCRHGADPLHGDPLAWLEQWLPRLTRPVRHPGNHRYAWALDRRVAAHLHGGRFPKRLDAGAQRPLIGPP